MRSLLSLLLFTLPLLAAPVRDAEEKAKPRAKLLGTLVVSAQVQSLHWTADGKHLVLVTDQRVLVYPRDQVGVDKPKPLTAFDRPDKYGEVGMTADGGLWVLAPAGQKVNAENRLHLWSAKTLLAGGEPKADRVIDLEADNPNGLIPLADGSSVFATVMTTRQIQNANPNGPRNSSYEYLPKFLRLSTKTGDVVKQTAFADLSEDRYAGSAFDPRTGRLYLAVHAGDETVVSCRDPDGGKPLWEKKLPLKPDLDSLGVFVLSPDGSRVAYRQPTLTVQQPGGGGGFAPRGGGGGPGGGRPQPVSYSSTSTLVTLDAKTGEPGAALAKADTHSANGHSFSADGRLLFAAVGTVEGHKLGVWEATGGAELKVWERGRADVNGAFAPSGYELAIVERERKDVYGPRVAVPSGYSTGSGQQWDTRQEVIRTDYISTVGLWDLSPVVR